jgi:cytochrome P450
MESIMESRNTPSKILTRPTIFHELLSCSLPPAEKTLDRLVDEGINMVAAGTLTTAHFLKTTSYHLLANPALLAKLKSELTAAIPNPEELPPLRDIEALPYLHAVVQEGFRLSYGATSRLPRVSPKTALQYKDWIIPAGTPVGMTSIILHENPNIFPNPKKFDPDRWFEKDAERLDRYLVNFSKGTRSCLGIYLAQAEIYLTLAAVFRRFDFELFQTDRSDVDVAHDFFNPSPKLDSKGLRVLVK